MKNTTAGLKRDALSYAGKKQEALRVDAPNKKKIRIISIWRRFLRLRRRVRDLAAQNQLLQERNARLFQRRLDQLRRDLSNQVKRQGLGETLDHYVEEFEHRAVRLALEHSDGDVEAAAALLGMQVEKLRKTMGRHGHLVSEEKGG